MAGYFVLASDGQSMNRTEFVKKFQTLITNVTITPCVGQRWQALHRAGYSCEAYLSLIDPAKENLEHEEAMHRLATNT